MQVVDVQVEVARPGDKALLRQLLEFNAYEFSRFDGADVGTDGRFGCRYLDLYWVEPDRHPFVIRVSGRAAGMVLVREGPPHSVAEFLVLPKYRRRGVGVVAAREVFERFPGEWTVHQAAGNDSAVAFWRKAVAVEFTETWDTTGTTQHFVVGLGD